MKHDVTESHTKPFFLKIWFNDLLALIFLLKVQLFGLNTIGCGNKHTEGVGDGIFSFLKYEIFGMVVLSEVKMRHLITSSWHASVKITLSRSSMSVRLTKDNR